MALISEAPHGQISLREQVVLFATVAGLVFLSRLPFLDAGYGQDWDAWAMVMAARKIAETGVYEPSRFPGYPVPEFFYSLIAHASPLAFNLVTAALSAAGIGLFAVTARTALGFRHAALIAVSLAFIPVVYIASTTAMDYMWALSFSLISLFFVYRREPLPAGLFLGLAIGSRLTAVPLLLPFGILLLRPGVPGGKMRRVVIFGMAAVTVAAVAFTPVFLRFGTDFLRSYGGYWPILDTVRFFTVDVWGVIGVAALGVTGLYLLVRLVRDGLTPSSPLVTNLDIGAWLLVVGLYFLMFMRLPHEGGYLIPTLPFVLLLLATYLSSRWLVGFCIMLLLSPFFLHFTSVGFAAWQGLPRYSEQARYARFRNETYVLDPLRGPLLADALARQSGMQFVEDVRRRTEQLGGKSVVVTGSWYTKFQVSLDERADASNLYVYLIDSPEWLSQRQAEGYRIYYLPQQLDYNRNTYNVDLAANGAVELPLE